MIDPMFIYIDEQEDSINGRKFVAIFAAIISPNNLQRFKESYYPKCRDLSAEVNGWSSPGGYIVGLVPVLHGSSLLKPADIPPLWINHKPTDDQKLAFASLLLDEFAKAGGAIIRLGLWIDNIHYAHKEDAIKFLLYELQRYLKNCDIDRKQLFVHELDKNSLKGAFNNFGQDQDAQWIASSSDVQLSIDHTKFLGCLYADKSEIGCQVADIAGYAALKFHKSRAANRSPDKIKSNFAYRFGQIYEEHRGLFVVDQILEVTPSR